jgi:uncharacterized membrane-anchored protein
MQDQHVPAIGRFYWPAFAAAALFGATAGNSVTAHLSTWSASNLYLPVLAAAFAAILYLEARDQRSSVHWYWLAVIIVPSAANHLSDISFAYLGVRRIWVCAGLLVVLVVTHLAFQSDTTRLIALRLQQRPMPTVPITDATYWVAMVVASTAGNLASDFLTIGRHFDTRLTCLILILPVAAAAALRRWTALTRTGTYWAVVVTLNALGTAMGDMLSADQSLGLGPNLSVVLAGAILAIFVFLTTSRETRAQNAK